MAEEKYTFADRIDTFHFTVGGDQEAMMRAERVRIARSWERIDWLRWSGNYRGMAKQPRTIGPVPIVTDPNCPRDTAYIVGALQRGVVRLRTTARSEP